MIIFPEGTRSTTGEIQEFKGGIGALVGGRDVAVLPCYLDGAFRAWPKGSHLPRPRKVRLIIGAPRNYASVPADKGASVAIAAELQDAVKRAGARIMQAAEETMVSWDGAELFYRAWVPPAAGEKALLLFHRGHEHSGRWSEFVEMLGLADVAIFAWDARGHGRSAGERGSAENFGMMVKDVEAFVRHICGAARFRAGEYCSCWRTASARSRSQPGCMITRRRFGR